LTSMQVQHQRACLDLRLNEAGSAAYQGIQTGLQLLELEGLDHIVVSAGGQPLDLVLPVAPGRQDEDGEAAVHAAQLADQVQSTHAGQSQIDDGNIMVVLLGAVQPLLRIGHCIDDMPQLRKARRQVVTQQRLVFDQQQLHVTLHGRTDACNSARSVPGRVRLAPISEVVVYPQIELLAALEVSRAAYRAAARIEADIRGSAQVAITRLKGDRRIELVQDTGLQTTGQAQIAVTVEARGVLLQLDQTGGHAT